MKAKLTRGEALEKLMGNYLSRNEDNLRARLAELVSREGWPENTLEIFVDRGWLKIMTGALSQTHYERACVTQELKSLVKTFNLKIDKKAS